jgi:hypothetical protein
LPLQGFLQAINELTYFYLLKELDRVLKSRYYLLIKDSRIMSATPHQLDSGYYRQANPKKFSAAN